MKTNRMWVVIILSLIGGSLWTLPVQAAFEVVEQNYVPSEYGNAQTGSFHRAMTGGEEMSAAQQAQLAKLVPEKDYPRYYGRFRLNFSTIMLDTLKNKSTGTDANGSVAKKRATANQVGFELAIGYSWSKDFRGDIEYLVNKNLNYHANPVLLNVNTMRQITAQIKNNSLLANIYYDFAGINRFRPYVTGGAGVAMNSVQTNLIPGGSNTLRRLSIAWQLGVGFRVAVFSRWFLDTSYRYIRLGNGIDIGANTSTSNFKLQGNNSLSATSIGFIYLF